MDELSNLDTILLGVTTQTYFEKWRMLPSTWGLSKTREKQILAASLQITLAFSPASILKLKNPIQCEHLIICDGSLMVEESFSREEFIAMLLHEIGHRLNEPDNMDKYISERVEFWADDFARDCGYEEAILSSLEKLKEQQPITSFREGGPARITRIRHKTPIQLRGHCENEAT